MRVPPALIAAAVLCGASPAFARADGRVVQIRWDDTGRSLEVWINCADEVCDDGEKLAGSKAYLFQLDQKDAVTLHMIATVPGETADAVRLDIGYTATGDDPDKAAQAALGKAFPAGAGKKGPEAATVIEETLPVSEETEILRGSGFTSGQMIDPVLGLTASSIPTEDRYHLRWFLGFSARY